MKRSSVKKSLIWMFVFSWFFSLFFNIPVQAQSLKASPDSIYFGPGKKITVSFSGAPGNNNDWVGIFKAGADARSYITYQYLQSKKSGTLTFNAPEEVGKYEFRMWGKEWTHLLAKTQTFIPKNGPPRERIPLCSPSAVKMPM